MSPLGECQSTARGLFQSAVSARWVPLRRLFAFFFSVRFCRQVWKDCHLFHCDLDQGGEKAGSPEETSFPPRSAVAIPPRRLWLLLLALAKRRWKIMSPVTEGFGLSDAGAVCWSLLTPLASREPGRLLFRKTFVCIFGSTCYSEVRSPASSVYRRAKAVYPRLKMERQPQCSFFVAESLHYFRGWMCLCVSSVFAKESLTFFNLCQQTMRNYGDKLLFIQRGFKVRPASIGR